MPTVPAAAIAATRAWLEQAVIGLNLCPFAKAVHVKGQIRYVVSVAASDDALLDELVAELTHLVNTPAEQTDTTLLIVPERLAEFDDFLAFVDLAEVSLRLQGLAGVLQIAHFHPDYVFADSDGPDDAANLTNRAPYPTLHLLREASLERATRAIPDAADIYERNIELARRLGRQGWPRISTPDDPDAGG